MKFLYAIASFAKNQNFCVNQNYFDRTCEITTDQDKTLFHKTVKATETHLRRIL